MLQKEHEELIHNIEKMISDGIQLVHGGHLIDWNDTKIPEIITKIKKDIQNRITPKLYPGDRLKHKISGQEMWVINDDGRTVYLNPEEPTIKYPLDKILYEFTITKRANK